MYIVGGAGVRMMMLREKRNETECNFAFDFYTRKNRFSLEKMTVVSINPSNIMIVNDTLRCNVIFDGPLSFSLSPSSLTPSPFPVSSSFPVSFPLPGGKLVVSTFFREIHAKYPSQLAEVVSGLPQDLQETLTIAIHGASNEPTPATNVTPLVVPPSITTTNAAAPAPGVTNNNDGDLSPSDNGEPVEAA